MRCKIPITPTSGAVMNATTEGMISDPTITKQAYVRYVQVESQATSKSVFLHRKDVNSFHCHNAKMPLRSQSAPMQKVLFFTIETLLQ